MKAFISLIMLTLSQSVFADLECVRDQCNDLPTQVSEPSTLLLFGLTAGLAFFLAKKRKR